MAVDLDALHAELARAVRAAQRRRGAQQVKPHSSKGPDPLIGSWAKMLVESGDLDAAIVEVSASDPDLVLSVPYRTSKSNRSSTTITTRA